MTGISKKTFDDCSTDQKLAILFDLMVDVRQHQRVFCPAQLKSCDTRMDAIEDKIQLIQAPARTQTAIATAGSAGIVGVILAVLKYLGVVQ